MYYVRPPPKIILEEIDPNEKTSIVDIKMMEYFLSKKDEPRKPKEFLSVFKEINSFGMPWNRDSSSEEEQEKNEENGEEKKNDFDQLALAGEILETLEWRGSLLINIPMFGMERKIGGPYALHIIQKEGNIFIGKDFYDNESCNLELFLKCENNEIILNFRNSDDIYFEGTLDLNLLLIKGKLENSDTPQGKGTFELKGYKKNKFV